MQKYALKAYATEDFTEEDFETVALWDEDPAANNGWVRTLILCQFLDATNPNPIIWFQAIMLYFKWGNFAANTEDPSGAFRNGLSSLFTTNVIFWVLIDLIIALLIAALNSIISIPGSWLFLVIVMIPQGLFYWWFKSLKAKYTYWTAVREEMADEDDSEASDDEEDDEDDEDDEEDDEDVEDDEE